MSKKQENVEKVEEKNVDPIKVGKKEEKAKIKAEKKRLKEEKKAMKKANTTSETKIVVGVVVAILAIALGIFGFYFYKSSYEAVATYNGGRITKAEYDVYYKSFAYILSTRYGYPDSLIPGEIAKKAAVDKVIVKLATEAGTKISDEDQATLNEIFNNDEYVQEFVSQGMDIELTRQLYYNDYLITQYLADLQDKVTEEEMIAYIKENYGEDVNLNEYKTSHILIMTTDESGNALADDAKAAARAKAEGLLSRALAGEDFATLAKENSEDSGTAENGGEYICYDDGYTVEEYINAVKALEVGKINATLVETSYGYHIIKLNEIVENGRVNNKTERELYVNEFTDGLNKEYNVEIDTDILNNYIISVTGSPIPSAEDEDASNEEEHVHTEDEAVVEPVLETPAE